MKLLDSFPKFELKNDMMISKDGTHSYSWDDTTVNISKEFFNYIFDRAEFMDYYINQTSMFYNVERLVDEFVGEIIK